MPAKKLLNNQASRLRQNLRRAEGGPVASQAKDACATMRAKLPWSKFSDWKTRNMRVVRRLTAAKSSSRPGVQARVAAQKGRPLLCQETVLDCLPLEVSPGHAKSTEGCPEQHYSGAAVWNAVVSAKEYPSGKAIPVGAKSRNGDRPSHTSDVPHYRMVVLAVVLRKQIGVTAAVNI